MTMPQIVAPKPLAILDPVSGELIEISTGPLTVEEAASRLPFVTHVLRELRRFEQFLADTVKADMDARGQTERRSGDVVYELKAESEWVVDDGGALFRVLHQATADNEITEFELGEACHQIVTFKFNHTKLNVLARRVPKIDEHRHRIEGAPRLKVKR